jgi:SAM-dependent methyltransferase
MNCPLCKSAAPQQHARATDIEYFTSDREFSLYRCSTCDILYVDPMLENNLADIYPSNYYAFADGKVGLASTVKGWLDRRVFGRLAKRLQGETLHALDIGGGSGFLLDVLKSVDHRFTETVVVDIDAQAGKQAVAKGHEYFHGRFEEYTPGARQFDLILMLNLIEHVADPRLVLEKCRALLRPGGCIWVKTPNFDSLDARIFRNRSWAGYHTPRHFVIFNRESFEKLAMECGLEVVSFNYTQGAPFWSISLMNELRRLGLAKASRERPMIYHPLTPFFQIVSAAFDFARKPFAKLSQMEVLLSPRKGP